MPATNCCICSMTPPPQDTGACCYLSAPDYDEFSCEDNFYHNDCMAKVGGRHFPNQTCININCDTDPPNSVKCNFSTLECGIDVPSPWEWIHSCAVCTSTTTSTTTTTTTTSTTTTTLSPEGACCVTCYDALCVQISQTCTNGVFQTACSGPDFDCPGEAGCYHVWVQGHSCGDIDCDYPPVTTTTTTTTEAPCDCYAFNCGCADGPIVDCDPGSKFDCDTCKCVPDDDCASCETDNDCEGDEECGGKTCCDESGGYIDVTCLCDSGDPTCCQCSDFGYTEPDPDAGCEPPDPPDPPIVDPEPPDPPTTTVTPIVDPLPSCGYCQWKCGVDGWYVLENHCDADCECVDPSAPCFTIGEGGDELHINCDGEGKTTAAPDQSATTTTTTTTTIPPCDAQSCTYKWTASGGWELYENNCEPGCYCGNPPTDPPHSEGDTRDVPCQGTPAATTTTTTTEEPTTTTTTTTLAPCSESTCSWLWTIAEGWTQTANNCQNGCTCSEDHLSTNPGVDGFTGDYPCEGTPEPTTTTTTISPEEIDAPTTTTTGGETTTTTTSTTTSTTTTTTTTTTTGPY